MTFGDPRATSSNLEFLGEARVPEALSVAILEAPSGVDYHKLFSFVTLPNRNIVPDSATRA